MEQSHEARSAAVGDGKVSLVIPVFNEGFHLTRFLEKIDRLELPLPLELVIVNDGSDDETARILENFAFTRQALVLQSASNRGKGAAVAAGIARASGSIIGIQDADFEYSFSDIPRLIEPIRAGRADVVYGSRFTPASSARKPGIRYFANRAVTALSNMCSGLSLSDMETCYKFFRADIVKNIRLRSERYGFEPEITAKIARLNVRIVELPVSYSARSRREGKKITWRDGVAAVWHILYFNFLASRR